MNNQSFPAIVKAGRLVYPRLDAYYPVVEGLPNPGVQYHINAAITNLMYKMIADQGYYENPMTQITASFELKNNQRDILSLSLIHYAYSGGAHGMTLVKSLTSDTRTGRVYKLWELFKPNSDYVKRLNEIILAQIKARDIQLLDQFKGITPDQDYYIADKSLVVYFQLYELAAYVYGILYFPISVYAIQDIIDENGPLGKMLY